MRFGCGAPKELNSPCWLFSCGSIWSKVSLLVDVDTTCQHVHDLPGSGWKMRTSFTRVLQF